MKLSQFFGDFTIRENIRPDWMVELTGYRLELDFLIEELQVAIEVQGIQHYEFTPYFHEDKQDFDDRQRFDELKRNACVTRGIELFEVFDRMSADHALEGIQDIALIPRTNQEYQPLDLELKIMWRELEVLANQRVAPNRKNQYLYIVERFNIITKKIAEHPELILNIHPVQSKKLLNFLGWWEKRLKILEQSVINREYKKWAKGNMRKNGEMPPIEEFLKKGKWQVYFIGRKSDFNNRRGRKYKIASKNCDRKSKGSDF